MIQILGIGSPYGDDQAGWRVVQLLQVQEKNFVSTWPSHHMECCDRPGLRLLELLGDADKVILIDAIKTGAQVGTLRQFAREDIEQIYTTTSTHGFGIGYAVKLAHALNLLPKEIVLHGIEIGDVQLSDTLSLPVQKAVVQLANQLMEGLGSKFL